MFAEDDETGEVLKWWDMQDLTLSSTPRRRKMYHFGNPGLLGSWVSVSVEYIKSGGLRIAIDEGVEEGN